MGKWELHAHTSEVSSCGKVPAAELVEMYVEAGYEGVVITDHLNGSTFRNHEGCSVEEQREFFLSGYRAAKRSAGSRLKVLLGMELCLAGSPNDYLLYGLTEDLLPVLYNQTFNIRQLSLPEASQFLRAHGIFIVQAHPFRNDLRVIDPKYIDGVETYNGHPWHASRNAVAKCWAEMYQLIQTSGSDFHVPDCLARGGVILHDKIETIHDLVAVLKGQPELIITEEGFRLH